jgi:putative ABC transport system permease protein
VKYAELILANLLRKKVRTVLTIGSFAIALFLFGILAILRGAIEQRADVAGADRLIVTNKLSIFQPLPLSYRERIVRIPGVEEVTFANWFGGVYQDEHNFFPQFAIDVPTYRQMFTEFKVGDDQWNAFVKDRQGAIVGKSTVNRFGWKIGDHIAIRGTIYPGNWEFNIRGIYEVTRHADDDAQFWFHWDYLQERRQFNQGSVGWYIVRISQSADSARITKSIDDEFSNSDSETRADTEKAFALSWVKQMGDIESLILLIGGVVFLTLLLVSGNTMAIAVRERMRELAVLKAIGYSNLIVLAFVLAESLAIAVAGSALGLGLAKLVSVLGDPTHLAAAFYLPSLAVVVGAALAVAVGALAAAFPAAMAGRLRVVEALRRN